MLKSTHAMILASTVLIAGTWCAMSWADGPKPPTTAPATAPAGRGGARGGRGGGPPAGLGQAMQEMGRSLTAIKAEVSDATKLEQTLKDIAILQRDVGISKASTPPTLRGLTGDKLKEETESYRVMMSSLLRTLLDLEDAVADKKPDDVKKALAQLDTLEKAGHAEFRKGD